MNYEELFVDFRGRTGRAHFAPALALLAAVGIFYHYLVFGQPGQYAMLTLLFPPAVLHARRVQDMGYTTWLLLVPAVPIAAAIWYHMYNPGHAYEAAAVTAALAVSALFSLWCLLGSSR